MVENNYLRIGAFINVTFAWAVRVLCTNGKIPSCVHGGLGMAW